MIQWLCCLLISVRLPVPAMPFDQLAEAPGLNAVLDSTFLRKASNLSSFGYHGYGTACYQSSDLHCKPSLETRTVGTWYSGLRDSIHRRINWKVPRELNINTHTLLQSCKGDQNNGHPKGSYCP